MKLVGQQTVGRDVVKLSIILSVLTVVWIASIAQSESLDDIYTTRAVVTGKDERNRPLGFKLCFEDVLIKASGDASIVSDKRFERLAANAGQYVSLPIVIDLRENRFTTNRAHTIAPTF